MTWHTARNNLLLTIGHLLALSSMFFIEQEWWEGANQQIRLASSTAFA